MYCGRGYEYVIINYMKVELLSILSLLYGSVGLLTLVAYFPTMRDLHRHKKPSANISTYALWAISSGVGVLYGIFILKDTLFVIVTTAIFLANTLVLLLRLRLPR